MYKHLYSRIILSTYFQSIQLIRKYNVFKDRKTETRTGIGKSFNPRLIKVVLINFGNEIQKEDIFNELKLFMALLT